MGLPKLNYVYPGYVASLIAKALGFQADQHQQNGLYGLHQLRVRLPDDATVYRVIVAPANAPITVNGVAIDEHFHQSITAEKAPDYAEEV